MSKRFYVPINFHQHTKTISQSTVTNSCAVNTIEIRQTLGETKLHRHIAKPDRPKHWSYSQTQLYFNFRFRFGSVCDDCRQLSIVICPKQKKESMLVFHCNVHRLFVWRSFALNFSSCSDIDRDRATFVDSIPSLPNLLASIYISYGVVCLAACGYIRRWQCYA